MRRREFIILLGTTAALPRTVTGQSPSKVYRVGLLITGAPVADHSPNGAGLIRGLAQHGYVLDKNLTFERRGAGMHMDLLLRLVDEHRSNRNPAMQ
jgi:putative ABC transport system substrate-binding protein